MRKLIIFLSLVLPLQFGLVLAQDDQPKPPSIDKVKSDALNGSVQAMNLIGNLYKSGNGGPFDSSISSPDFIEAKKWFEMAAEKGYAPAIFNLGTLYERGGFGLEKDLGKARQYYQNAVNRGFLRAQAWLDNLDRSNSAKTALDEPTTPQAKIASEVPTRIVEPEDKSRKLVMIEVIQGCNDHYNFTEFSGLASCIRGSYDNFGTDPNGVNVKNFYSLLDGINEEFQAGKIGWGKASADLIKAWQSTIDAGNKASRARSAGSDPAEDFNRNQRYWDCLARPGALCLP